MSGSYKKDKEWSHPLKVVSSYQVKELEKLLTMHWRESDVIQI